MKLSNITKIADKMKIMRESCEYITTPELEYSVLNNAVASETAKLPSSDKYFLLPNKFKKIVDRADTFGWESYPLDRGRDNFIEMLFDAMLLANKYPTIDSFNKAYENYDNIKSTIDTSKYNIGDTCLVCAYAHIYLESPCKEAQTPYGSKAMCAVAFSEFGPHNTRC